MYRPITMYQIVCDRCGEVLWKGVVTSVRDNELYLKAL